MRFLGIMTLLIFSMLSLSARQKIVGGRKVQGLQEAPYFVAFDGCGGSLVAPKWVLSAAHCEGVFRYGGKMGVLDRRNQGVTLEVKRVLIHPGYEWLSNTNDFALIELKNPVDLEATDLGTIALPDSDFVENGFQAPGVMATVYGFGNTTEGGLSSDYLMEVDVPIVSIEEANSAEAYNGRVDETMIPAGYEEGGKDSCQGDSGGPMISYDQDYNPVQVGVVSWGFGCARAKKYGVYAKTSVVYDWIKKTISK